MPRKKTTGLKRVALLFNPLYYGLEIVRGLVQYARIRHGHNWTLTCSFINKRIAADLDGYDGVVADKGDLKILRQASRAKCAKVLVIGDLTPTGLPEVQVDDIAVGKMGAEYFLDKGYRRLAFVRAENSFSSNMRCEGFLKVIGKMSESISTYQGHIKADDTAKLDLSGMVTWVNSSREPIGLMAHNDKMAHLVLTELLRRNIPIPGKVAILGVDNNELTCRLTVPTLSSIDIGFERLGYIAGMLLGRAMEGQPAPENPCLVEPIGVVTRQSTEMIAITDPVVLKAAMFINKRAYTPISMTDVAKAAGVTAKSIQKRFESIVGRSPQDEINRIRVERTKRLLIDTHLSEKQIARSCGFPDSKQMQKKFTKAVGVNPYAFRLRFASPEEYMGDFKPAP